MSDVIVNGGEVSDYLLPTIEAVAALIRSRTKDVNGNEVGTFTEKTRPTAEQCQEAIDNQRVLLTGVVARVGDLCGELATAVVALNAAVEIEISYFGEQIRTDRSAYFALVQRAQNAVEGLIKCVTGDLPGTCLPGQGSGGSGVSVPVVSSVVAGSWWGPWWGITNGIGDCGCNGDSEETLLFETPLARYYGRPVS